MSLRFEDNVPQFLRKNESLKDMVLSKMALDIERSIKLTAGTPVKQGALKASVRTERTGTKAGQVSVIADKVYAAYQERGARFDGSHVVKNYSTGGTSSGWFKRSIDLVWRNRQNYIAEAKQALGL